MLNMDPIRRQALGFFRQKIDGISWHAVLRDTICVSGFAMTIGLILYFIGQVQKKSRNKQLHLTLAGNNQAQINKQYTFG